jgi:antitoxin component of MazEF toxin-antitoxin module
VVVMKKKLIRHGNSFALIIDRPLMDILHIKDNTVFDIRTDGNILYLVPARNLKIEKEMLKELDEYEKRYSAVVKKHGEDKPQPKRKTA